MAMVLILRENPAALPRSAAEVDPIGWDYHIKDYIDWINQGLE